MLITHVMIHVKPEHLEAFKAATLDNARNSVREPGIARFDVIQQADDPTRFVLVEAFSRPRGAPPPPPTGPPPRLGGRRGGICGWGSPPPPHTPKSPPQPPPLCSPPLPPLRVFFLEKFCDRPF